ncbi:MAG: hypothetical protein HOO96_16235 [Polyangiaceae bacterium]|nr:hypothetical protein [Polyangiaceae bacterium]
MFGPGSLRRLEAASPTPIELTAKASTTPRVLTVHLSQENSAVQVTVRLEGVLFKSALSTQAGSADLAVPITFAAETEGSILTVRLETTKVLATGMPGSVSLFAATLAPAL